MSGLDAGSVRRLVLLRHGQSLWNLENRFTGWTDVDLSAQGVAEARAAGRSMAAAGFTFDVAFTSLLKRAVRTLWMVQDEMDLMWIPVHRSWRLNERHYGALQGLDKAETSALYGEMRVRSWRRSYDTRPPQLRDGDPRFPYGDLRYRGLTMERLPRGESLSDTIARVLPFWERAVAPSVRTGRRVLIVAHGNSLRGLVKVLDHVSDEDISRLEIPTGRPLVYDLGEDLRPLGHRYVPISDDL